MTAPTYVAAYQSATYFDGISTNNIASGVAVQSGDRVLVVAEVSDAGTTLGTPTGLTGATFTSLASNSTTNYCGVYAWGATATTSETVGISNTASNSSNWWGFRVYVFRDSEGFGVASAAQATRQRTLSLTADSAVVALVGDWDAASWGTPTWLNVNGAPTQDTYYNNATWHTVGIARWSNIGSAGSKTVGLSTPSSGSFSTVAVEVLGTASAADPYRRRIIVPRAAAHRAASW